MRRCSVSPASGHGTAGLSGRSSPAPGRPGRRVWGSFPQPHLLPQVTRVFLRCQRLGPRRQPSPRTSRKRRRLLVPGLKLPPLLRPADALGVSGPRSHPALRTVQGRGGGLCAPALVRGGAGAAASAAPRGGSAGLHSAAGACVLRPARLSAGPADDPENAFPVS